MKKLHVGILLIVFGVFFALIALLMFGFMFVGQIEKDHTPDYVLIGCVILWVTGGIVIIVPNKKNGL